MKYLIFLILALISFKSYSQNDTVKLSVNMTLGGNFNSGNFNSYNLYLKSQVNREYKNNQILWSPNFKYTRVSNDNKLVEREIYSTFNYSNKNGRTKYMIFNQSEHSFMRKVDYRGSLGIGIGYRIIDKSLQLDVSEVVMPEVMMSSNGNKYDNVSVRLSTRFKIIYKSNNMNISSITYIQPSLYTVQRNGGLVSVGNNTNIRSNNSIDFDLNKGLSIGIGSEIIYQTYSSYVDNKVKPLDYNLFLFIKISNKKGQ